MTVVDYKDAEKLHTERATRSARRPRERVTPA